VKDPLLYIIHIHESLQKILTYTRDGRDSFMADSKTQDAVVRNFSEVNWSGDRKKRNQNCVGGCRSVSLTQHDSPL
jgi:uncharacterized protein with HEPN domain